MVNIGTDMARDMFLAGARSVANELGASGEEADAFASEVVKQAASRKIVLDDDDDDDDDDTWWSRNKHWALPTLVGAGALWLGNDAGLNGRKDRNVFQNIGGLLSKRLMALFGISEDPLYRSTTTTR